MEPCGKKFHLQHGQMTKVVDVMVTMNTGTWRQI